MRSFVIDVYRKERNARYFISIKNVPSWKKAFDVFGELIKGPRNGELILYLLT